MEHALAKDERTKLCTGNDSASTVVLIKAERIGTSTKASGDVIDTATNPRRSFADGDLLASLQLDQTPGNRAAYQEVGARV